jgi:hypothetical protein
MTVTADVALQLLPSVPVTKYNVVVNGLIVPIGLGFQTYELAPEAPTVVELPKQMELTLAEATTVGNEFTVTVIFAVFLQLLTSVPVTLYEIVVVGLTV